MVEEPAPAVRTRTAIPVRWHLGAFTAVLVTPVLLFVGFVLWQFASAERGRLERDAGETARTVGAALDLDIAGLLAALDVTATSAYLRTGDLAGFYAQASELRRKQGFVPVLTDMTGQQLVNLRLPYGAALPKTNLPWDREAIAAGRPFVSELFTGIVSKQPQFAVVMPVVIGGVTTYILNFSLELGRFQRLLAAAEIPNGYTVSIIDRAGTIAARNTRPEEFVGRPATEDLRKAAAGSGGNWSGTTVDGESVFGTYVRSRNSDFRVAVGIPYSQLNAPLLRSLSLFAALGTVVVALSVLLGLLVARRITLPIRAIAGRAALLGRGEPVPALSTGLREADQVGAVLTAAAASLLARETDLREANDEIQRFAYIVSHDLRSPLVNIMGFTTELEALRDDTFRRLDALRQLHDDPGARQTDKQLGEDFDEAIRFIKTSIGKMDRLINAILRLSREGRREFHSQPVDMDALLGGIAASHAHQADAANAAISISSLPGLTSDRLALEQIFSNLIDNALKYLRRGVPGRIEVTGRRAGGKVVYEVQDNGRGVDQRDRERIFELFRRSGAQDRPGEGIGLAHVRALVRRLGGTISLTSEPGQGSTFRVTLPPRWEDDTQKRAA